MLPTQICHCDWGTAANKRWLAKATLGADARYTAHAPALVRDHEKLIPSLREEIGRDSCALVGFDFPIGIPASYARLAGITDFRTFLQGLSDGGWANFYIVARTVSDISVQRPFYPFAPGNTRQAHLLSALGLGSIDDLRRECEKRQTSRRAACPLFWTLGANQVGKGAIVGWRDVLAPALRDGDAILLWPFDGHLCELLQAGKIVIAETYPAECYGWLFPETLKGKGKIEVRRKTGSHLLKWADTACVELDPTLTRTIEEGFPEGDDSFDAVVGLFGMMEVISGRRPSDEPTNRGIQTLEGWILGQARQLL